MNIYRVTTTSESYWMWRLPTWLGRIVTWWRITRKGGRG